MYQLLSEYEAKWALMNLSLEEIRLSGATCYTIGYRVAEAILEQKDSSLAAYVPEAVECDAAAFVMGWNARYDN